VAFFVDSEGHAAGDAFVQFGGLLRAGHAAHSQCLSGHATPHSRRPCPLARLKVGELVDRDQEQLRLLSLFHYITAGITAVFGSIPLIHVAMGVVFLFLPRFFLRRPPTKVADRRARSASFSSDLVQYS
jgi:hypothetical protein